MPKTDNVMRNLRISAVLLAIVICALASSQARAAVVATYDFTRSSLASSDSDANSAAGNILKGSALNVSSGPGSTRGNPGGSFEFGKQNLSASFDANCYIEFTVTANAGFKLNLSGSVLGFESSSPNTIAGNWAVRSSINGYGSDLATGSTGTSSGWIGGNANPSGTQFDGLDSVGFRIYAWNPKNVDLYFDNINLSGVSVVPEPANAALGFFCIAALGVTAGRRLLKARTA